MKRVSIDKFTTAINFLLENVIKIAQIKFELPDIVTHNAAYFITWLLEKTKQKNKNKKQKQKNKKQSNTKSNV